MPKVKQPMTLSQRLTALASFGPVFAEPGFCAATLMPSHQEDGVMVLGGFAYADQLIQFEQMAYDCGWVRSMDWAGWANAEPGARLLHDPAAVAYAQEDDLAAILTTCIRQDRFCEGALVAAFENGLIARVIDRAQALLVGLQDTDASREDKP